MNRLLQLTSDENAQTVLGTYLETYTGRHFDKLVSPESRITASDIVAVSCLSVKVPPEAAVSFIDDEGDLSKKIESLRQFPILDDFDSWFEEANDLYGLLKEKKGVKSVIASKLLHAKLPELIPIYDRLTKAALGYPKHGYWKGWHQDLVDADGEIQALVADLRLAVPLASELPLLRVLDIIVWGREENNKKRKKAKQ